MFLILLTITLAVLKFLEVNLLNNVSWWWIAGLLFLTFIWFEVFERLFGFDKKALHARFDEIQKRRKKLLTKKDA